MRFFDYIQEEIVAGMARREYKEGRTKSIS